jgi:hypothetical protein
VVHDGAGLSAECSSASRADLTSRTTTGIGRRRGESSGECAETEGRMPPKGGAAFCGGPCRY